MQNALTVDLEDWYMTSGLDIAPSRWHEYEDRVVQNTQILLKLFDRHRVKGTFFVLGCIAEKYPELVREIVIHGHEIGSHGGWHRLLTSQTIEQFREDLRYSKRVLEEVSGQTIRLYRAPSWSLEPSRYEALRILEEEGFVCDSSIQPFWTPLSGVRGAPHMPFQPVLDERTLGLVEFPPTVARVAGMTMPFSGGFYLRAMPYPIVRWALKRINRTRPGMIYLHPWEIDPNLPKIKTSLSVTLVQYYGLSSMKPKLERLLDAFEFVPLGHILEKIDYPRIPLIKSSRRGSL